MQRTKADILAEIARLEAPCHEAFKAIRAPKIEALRAQLETAPTDLPKPGGRDAALERWEKAQADHAKFIRNQERRGY